MEYITESQTKGAPRPPRIFERLSPCVVLSSPVLLQPGVHREEPELVIICTWMGAAPRHIRKYAQHYSETYPYASILITTTSVPDMIGRPDSHQARRLRPAIDRIKRTVAEAAATCRKPRILLHILSNGGSHTACEIAETYMKELGGPLPVTAMVLDSCPGSGDYRRCIRAIGLNLPKSPLVRFFGLIATYVAVSFVWVLTHLLGRDNSMDGARRRLNDNQLFDLRAPRLYAYSSADQIVGYDVVEEHAAQALKRGWTVVEMTFEHSSHCCLVRDNALLYWRAISGIWKIGIKTANPTYIEYVYL